MRRHKIDKITNDSIQVDKLLHKKYIVCNKDCIVILCVFFFGYILNSNRKQTKLRSKNRLDREVMHLCSSHMSIRSLQGIAL